MKKVFSLLVACAALSVLTISCASKKKADETADAGVTAPSAPDTTNDNSIVNKEMSFNPTGSDSGNISGLYTVNFEYDQATLSAEAKKRLSDNAAWVKGNAGMNVQIEGHCDERGSIEYNLALGERRAKAAKAYLVSLGVDARRLSIISYGEEKPLAQGDSEETLSKNRRANFVPMPK
jgi:peptidoglycan-associated lipoprotein